MRDLGDGRIMRFVELRQVRAANDCDDLAGETDREFRSYASEDRYLVSPVIAERSTPSHHHYYQHHADKPDPVYVNVEQVLACRTSANQQTSTEPLVEEDTECHPASAGQ